MVADLGIKILEILKSVHDSGYIYGDLKLDNILFDNQFSQIEDVTEAS